MATNLDALRGRIWEPDLVDIRGHRLISTRDWKNRLMALDRMYRGEWAEVFPDETVMIENPYVMNMVQTEMDDISSLVTEANASVHSMPVKETDAENDRASLRESAYDTYWSVNRGNLLVPRLAMDLAGAGACFLAATVDDDSPYPCIYRIDPRYAYPDIQNNQLLDLLVVEEMNWRVAARTFPQLGLDQDPSIQGKKIEVLHYYSPEECVQAVLSYGNGETPAETDVNIVHRWSPGFMPVGFAQLDSYDGVPRGKFDQVKGSLLTKNRIVKMYLEYADQLIYSEFKSKGLLNPEQKPGPGAHWRLDPNVPDADVERVPPAGPAPQLQYILELLDREQRGSVGYPAARQGEVSQSIASASFVASTQGQLTTTVKNIQRLIASAREDINTACARLDEAYLDFEKPLARPIGKKNSYVPSKLFRGADYENKVVYGASAGLDRIQADQRVLQLSGAGLIGKETATGQIDFIQDVRAQRNEVDKETTQNILLQKLLSTGDVPTMMALVSKQMEGLSFLEAVTEVQKQMAAAQAAPPEEGAAPAGPGGEMPPPEATEKGAVPQVAFAPPPLEQIQARSPAAGRVTQLHD